MESVQLQQEALIRGWYSSTKQVGGRQLPTTVTHNIQILYPVCLIRSVGYVQLI